MMTGSWAGRFASVTADLSGVLVYRHGRSGGTLSLVDIRTHSAP